MFGNIAVQFWNSKSLPTHTNPHTPHHTSTTRHSPGEGSGAAVQNSLTLKHIDADPSTLSVESHSRAHDALGVVTLEALGLVVVEAVARTVGRAHRLGTLRELPYVALSRRRDAARRLDKEEDHGGALRQGVRVVTRSQN